MSVWDPDVFFSHGHEMEAPSGTGTEPSLRNWRVVAQSACPVH